MKCVNDATSVSKPDNFTQLKLSFKYKVNYFKHKHIAYLSRARCLSHNTTVIQVLCHSLPMS